MDSQVCNNENLKDIKPAWVLNKDGTWTEEKYVDMSQVLNCFVCRKKVATRSRLYDNYNVELLCETCKPESPMISYTIHSQPITNLVLNEKILMTCEWTEGCHRPAFDWDYKQFTNPIRYKKRIHCSVCHYSSLNG